MESSSPRAAGGGRRGTVLVHLSHPESEHPKTLLAHPLISPRVVEGLAAVVLAVDLYYQSRLQAGKVGEVRAHGDLAPKLAPQQLPAAQAVPEPSPGPGHLLSQHTCPAIPSCPLDATLTNHSVKLAALGTNRKSAC